MLARMRVTGGTYLITRTTSDRRFLLKPSPEVRQVFLYCLFRAAQKHGVLVHGSWVESTHVHILVTDTRGELSDFMHWLNRHVALCLLEHYRKHYPRCTLETLWSVGSFNETLIVTPEGVLEAFVYGATNPVKDGLVADYQQWPGLCSTPRDWLEPPRAAKRPELFFDQDDPEQATVAYQFTIPPQFSERTPELFVCDVERMIEDEQRAIRATRGDKPFLGAKHALAVDPFDTPTTQRPRGQRKPTVKAGTGQSAAYKLALQAVRSFRHAYRAAWLGFCNGEQTVFPAGTLMLRKLFGVQCSPDDFGCWCCLGIRAPADAAPA
jgi:putative transposase